VKEVSASAITFGIGLGGFFDGITLHSILQWHHMISNVVPPTNMENMRLNMLADGLFDAFCWLVVMAALILLYREAKRSLPPPRIYLGWIIFGAGVFNFVEGIVDHEILQVHHVRQVPFWLAWDLGFLAIGGVMFIVIGWVLAKTTGSSAALPAIRAA